ncbi:MAG: OmpA family protein [Ignavibacteriales bacterium]|nr:OmpA family protein [Ignavibacteriales bacterium]
MKKLSALLLISFLISPSIFTQEDCENCKDHPLLTRFPGFYIYETMENFSEATFYTSMEDTKTIEGNISRATYYIKEGAKEPSALQLFKNYENAIVSKGGKKIFSNTTYSIDITATYQIFSNNVEYWVGIFQMAGDVPNSVNGFLLVVLGKEVMTQSVTANAILDSLTKSGSIQLYINFETAKADIKKESQPIIDEIAKMLKDNPTIKVSVEGHTDNTGTAASNQTLSENRAKSVMNSLIASGIDKTRLTSKGWGQSKPITDNKTEDGKTKNRRVEIVKM